MTKVATLLLLVLALMAVSSAQSAPAPATPPSGAQTASPQPDDELAQMRDDLNKLESLNSNMSTEIEFLRDQNLQILLRTNVQMWTILVRDLRQQVQREERRRAMPQRPADHSSATKPDR